MEGKLYTIFPTPVIKYKFPRKFNNIEINFFDEIKNEINKNYGNYTTKDNYILKDDSMKDIFKFCQSCLDSYFEKIYCPSVNTCNLQLTQSWINYTKKGEFHHAHTHPNSIISGVFYMSANKKYDEIIFNKPDSQNQYEILTKKRNDFNTPECSFTIETYDLLLFPSGMYHRVPPVTNEDTRISLAFNSFFRGTIGDAKGLTELKL